MNELFANILDAHGGLDRWNEYERVEATIVSGGGFFPLKGVPQDSGPRRMTVRLHEDSINEAFARLESGKARYRIVLDADF